jgi:hypothetical protein
MMSRGIYKQYTIGDAEKNLKGVDLVALSIFPSIHIAKEK